MTLPSSSSTRPARFLLAVGAGVYVLALLAATLEPGPGNWGLHLPAFLSPGLRLLVLALAAGGAAAIVLAAFAPGAEPRPAGGGQGRARGGETAHPSARARTGRGSRARRGRRSPSPSALWIPTLAAYGAILYLLRTRTHFLGDGLVWLNSLLGGETRPFNEPLSAAVWKGTAVVLSALGLPIEPGALALLPVLCGVGAAAIAWPLLGEALPGARERWIAWGLFLTTGFTQIYFGYIESYPVLSLVLLAFLWLALRHARGADPPWLLGVALAVAIAFHLLSLLLLPAYVLAVLRRESRPPLRAALVLLPLVLGPVLLVLAGSGPNMWLEPFRAAARSAPGGAVESHFRRPYANLSWDHGLDVLNAAMLAAPVPLLLLLAWAAGRRGRVLPTSRGGQVLAAAAAPGLLLAAGLMLPVAPAQDWDLSAMLLLPAAIAGVVAGGFLYADRRLALGSIALSAGSLLAFVLVNASEPAAIARFKRLIAPEAPLSPYGRGYAASMISEFYEDLGLQDSARVYAEEALRAEPTNTRYWMRSGTILYNLGRYDEAIAHLRESIRRGWTRGSVHHNLGLCYTRTGRVAEAIAEFRVAIERDGERPEYRHNLGLVLFESGRIDSARAVWLDVLRRWPGYPLTVRSWTRRFGTPPPPT